jgi:hypothetical protein
MYQPPKYFWNNNEIAEFCNIIQPFRDGLISDVVNGYQDLGTAVKWWDNFTEPRHFEFDIEVFKNRIQTFDKEKKRFETNIEGGKMKSLAYNMTDSTHRIIYRINPNSEEEAALSIKYASACQLLDILGQDCVRLSYFALAPNTTKFRMVCPEYREVNNVLRVIVPISVPDGVSLFLNPRGNTPRVAAVSNLKEICAHDTQRFPEIENSSDEWTIMLWLDILRTRFGLEPGETNTNKFFHLY